MEGEFTPLTSCHESWALNQLCGKRVKVVLWDNTEYIGVLQKDTLATIIGPPTYDDKRVIGYGLIGATRLHFKKTHVKRVVEVW